ncbi:MAG TPA: hypothetical protein PKY50_17125 [Candidatus Competibacter sp.]|nr:hypothetical protein [Candidatus Competibacter sp.]
MNPLIPVKSVKGLLALSQRIYELPQRLRTLLILINGKVDVDSLKKDTSFIASLKKDSSLLGDIEAMLFELEQSGFIEFAKDRGEAARMTASFQARHNELIKQDSKFEESIFNNPIPSDETTIKNKLANKTTSKNLDATKEPSGAFPQSSSETLGLNEAVTGTKIDQAKNQLKDFLKDLMGSDYELVSKKIASCDNAERFKALLYGFEDIIQNYGSKKIVENFKVKFKDFY